MVVTVKVEEKTNFQKKEICEKILVIKMHIIIDATLVFRNNPIRPCLPIIVSVQ